MKSRVLARMRSLLLASVTAFMLAACGGGGGDSDPPGSEPPPTGETVTISGRITFERPLFETAAGGGLDLANPVELPAREVVVEAIAEGSNSILATTTTDTSGNYTLSVPANRSMFIRAKAQMLQEEGDSSWHFRVLSNTNGDALYALDGSTFNSGTDDSTRNLHAPTGWGGTRYTGTRAAAPFAILDTVFRAKQIVLDAEPETDFPELDLFWSPDNRTLNSQDPLCADNGDLGTTFYLGPGDQEDDCGDDFPSGIYILGSFEGGDTDEFDQHVIAHEFGHYYEQQFSRSDSIGGEHADSQLLDMRVAFGEGWGNAYSGMVLNDPVYRDSYQGVATDFSFDIEDDFATVEGWYSEMSAAEIIWDLYDDGDEAGDSIALGFGPIHSVMTGPQVSTQALTSIYTFAEGLRAARPSDAAAINTLLSGENIFGSGDFGQGETNFAGLEETTEPLYVPIELGGQEIVCTRGSSDGNKAGDNRFLRFDLGSAALVGIQAASTTSGSNLGAIDPDIFVYRRGDLVVSGTMEGNETIAPRQLDAGTYVIEVYDFGNTGGSVRCMNVSVTGA